MKFILNNLLISKFAILMIESIFSTKLFMISNNHRFYDSTISRTLLSKLTSNNSSQMNSYSSMTKTNSTLFLLSTLTTFSFQRKLVTKFNLFISLFLKNSNYAILTPLKSFLISTFIDLYQLIQSICFNLFTHAKCFTNST